MPFRLSYHDLAARATESVPRERLARAIERLSAAYREGRSIDSHRTREGRAAYLVHTLPAHVCDVRRLLLDELEGELRKPELRVLALGAGPGTEAFARADQVGAWDESFAAMRAVFEPALRDLDPSFGTAWTWDVPSTLMVDLAGSVGEAPLAAAQGADLLLASNLVSEILPRGTAELPPRFLQNFEAIGERAQTGAAFVILDRAHAPGVVARIERTARALGARRKVALSEIYEREVRCACALTRATKALYAKVSLPTTKVEDRPIGNTRTAWTLVRFE